MFAALVCGLQGGLRTQFGQLRSGANNRLYAASRILLETPECFVGRPL